MPLWSQHLVVILLVLACLAVVARQFYSTLAGKKSRLGNCCARGCAGESGTKPAAAVGQRIVFLPADALRKRR